MRLTATFVTKETRAHRVNGVLCLRLKQHEKVVCYESQSADQHFDKTAGDMKVQTADAVRDRVTLLA